MLALSSPAVPSTRMSGAGFADALAGAPLAGALGAPLYLTRPDCVPGDVVQDLWDVGARRVTFIGGPAAVGYEVQDALERLESCG